MIDESFWWYKNISMGKHDPKRIQRRLRTTQNSCRSNSGCSEWPQQIEKGKKFKVLKTQ
jgi:hypothetical protein